MNNKIEIRIADQKGVDAIELIAHKALMPTISLILVI
jgi:hypothetical protein